MRILYLVLLLTLVCQWVESSPTRLGTLEFDSLDADLDSLSYEVEEEDLDDYEKSSEEQDANKNFDSSDKVLKSKGFKKNNNANKKINQKHNSQDVKKLYKSSGIHDQGAYEDDGVYALLEAAAKQAVGIKGNEDRTYRKGTKTRGFHRVHHKDEYKKDKVFFEDDETKGTIKKIGAKEMGYNTGVGAGFGKGHFHHDRHKGIYGKRKYSDNGVSDKEFNSNTDSQGFESYFRNK